MPRPGRSHTLAELVMVVFENENLFALIASYGGKHNLLTLRVVSKDLWIQTQLCRPALSLELETNRDRVLAHRQWFEYIRRTLAEWEGVRDESLRRFWMEHVEEGLQCETETEWQNLQHEWWIRYGVEAEKRVRQEEAELMVSLAQSVANLGPLSVLV